MVAAEYRVVPLQAQVIADVAGCVNCVERPVGTREGIAVAEQVVGLKCRIDAFAAARKPCVRKLLHDRAAATVAVAVCIDGRACGGTEWPGERGMVKVAMGHDDVADGGVVNAREQGVEVGFIVWAGVDYCQRLGAEQIGVCAQIGHGGWVWRKQEPQTRREGQWNAGHWGEIHMLLLSVGRCAG